MSARDGNTRRGLELRILGQPSPPKERADAAKNRLQILEAARKLLETTPIEELCMDRVAEEAGVGKGTLYRRFPDRSHLFHALIDEEARRFQARALEGFGLPDGANDRDHLFALLGALFDFRLQHAPLLAAARAREGGAVYDHPAYAFDRDLIEGYLRRATARGEIESIDPAVTAELLLAGLEPALLRHLAEGVEPKTLKRRFRRIWEQLLRSTE
jgi:AcrR family transcriptional regulator